MMSSHHLRDGDHDAYRMLFEAYAPRIYQFSLSYLKTAIAAEEVVQEVFIKIWNKRESLDEHGNLKAYIFKIAINTIYDVIRRRNIELAYKDYAEAKPTADYEATWEAVVYDEMLVRLNKLVNTFPEQRQKIFRMSREEGLSNEEIAKKLKLSKRTVENQIYRAVCFLKDHFKNELLLIILFLHLFAF